MMLFLQSSTGNTEGLGDFIIDLKDKMADNTQDLLGLQTAYDTVISGNKEFLSVFSILLSILCAMFIILNLLRKIHAKPEPGEDGPAWTMKDVWKSIIMIFAIMLYQTFFRFAEMGLLEVSNLVVMNGEGAKTIWEQSMSSFLIQRARDAAALYAENSTNMSVFGFDLEGIGQTLSVALAPNKYVYAFSAIGALAGFFNYLIVYMAYMDRSLVMLILNVLAPLVFALSVLDGEKTNGVVRKFFMMLVTIFLVFPFLVIGFEIVDALYINLSSISSIFDTYASENELRETMNSLSYMAAEGVTDFADLVTTVTNYDVFLRLPLIILCIVLKLKYMNLISSTLWKILN